jgi:antitoxin VapB
MALSIKDPETERLARALAERLRRVGGAQRRAALLEDLAAIRRRWSAMPVLDPRGADAVIGYDENGLPR